MRAHLLKYIRCPLCKSEFDLKIIKENNIEIEEGILTCKNCRFATAITEGIVNLLFNLDADTLKEVHAHIKARHEMFEKAMAEAKLPKNSVILDLGAETGWTTAQLAKLSEYCIAVVLCKPIKLELSEVFLKDENIFFERCMANMMRLPFADECVDVVLSIASLHHASSLAKSMYEISRVLKDEGKLILVGEVVVPHGCFGGKEFLNAKKWDLTSINILLMSGLRHVRAQGYMRWMERRRRIIWTNITRWIKIAI
jgi:ubiquinone/menaquinone biosynthesis C-methylase UbiE